MRRNGLNSTTLEVISPAVVVQVASPPELAGLTDTRIQTGVEVTTERLGGELMIRICELKFCTSF